LQNQIQISFKVFTYILIAIVVSCILLSIVIYGIITFAQEGKDWIEPTISSVGNIAGGIIGGIVAFIVASFQVRKAFEAQDTLIKRTAFASLRLIKEEIEYNQLIIESVLQAQHGQGELLESEIDVIQWNTTSLNLGTEVPDKYFYELCDLYRKILMLKKSSGNTPDITFLNNTLTSCKENIALISELISHLKKP
jgi:hypothetical protein